MTICVYCGYIHPRTCKEMIEVALWEDAVRDHNKEVHRAEHSPNGVGLEVSS